MSIIIKINKQLYKEAENVSGINKWLYNYINFIK